MRVLVTNDDGIESPGVAVLAATALSAGLEPVVAAPASDYSGIGAALTGADNLGKIAIGQRRLPDLPDVPAFAVAASPALIVILALAGAFGPPPDAVLSGINDGPNLGIVVLYSGTVGAALSAAVHAKPALAVSLHTKNGDSDRNWHTAGVVTASLLPLLSANEHPTVLNVNVPNRPLAELQGIRRASLTALGTVSPSAVPGDGGSSVALSWKPNGLALEPGCDEDLLLRGFATVTPLASITEAQHHLPLPEWPAGDPAGPTL